MYNALIGNLAAIAMFLGLLNLFIFFTFAMNMFGTWLEKHLSD